MRTFVKSRLSLLLAGVLLTSPLIAQENVPDEVLQRLHRLEAEAAARDAKIESLEAELREYESGHIAPSQLEVRVNALADEIDLNAVAPDSDSVKFGGQLRFRGEFRTVKNYGNADVDRNVDFVIQRTRFDADFRVTENIRAFVQIQDSRNWGEEGSTLNDLEGVDIHQAYVDYENVFGHPITVRAGRQELSYGDQRLVSPLDWHPVGRSFDGVRTWYEGEEFQVDFFAMNVLEASTVPGGEAWDDQVFGGLYFTTSAIERHVFDAYVFFRHFNTETFIGETGSVGDLTDGTVGFRFKGKTAGFDYSAEAVFQFGERGDDDVKAYAWAVVAGYTFDCTWSPRIGVEWDFASGDQDPTDGDYETFDPLFAFVHAYQGYLDIFAWRNGHDVALKVSAKPTDDLFMEIATHFFRLDSDSDAWYNAPGRPIRRVAGGVDNNVGIELDLHFKYRLDSATNLWFGYSHFFAGDYVEQTGKSPDTDWIFFQVTLDF